jgi:peptide methionine sulfoxide reductase MsrB
MSSGQVKCAWPSYSGNMAQRHVRRELGQTDAVVRVRVKTGAYNVESEN